VDLVAEVVEAAIDGPGEEAAGEGVVDEELAADAEGDIDAGVEAGEGAGVDAGDGENDSAARDR
jgi:hypothetical protein